MASAKSAPSTELREQIEAALRKEYDEKYQKDVTEYGKKLEEENKKIIDQAIEEIRGKLQPPTADQLKSILDQEYLEFKVSIGGTGRQKQRTFVIQELPQAIEKKFFRKAKEMLIPIATEVASLSLNILEGDAARKVVALLNACEPLMDVAAELVAIALNPFGEEEDVDVEWVRNNLSTTRIVAVVNVQLEANRMRDFFSLVSRSSNLVGIQ